MAKADQLSPLDTDWLDYYFSTYPSQYPSMASALVRVDCRTGAYSTLRADGTWRDQGCSNVYRQQREADVYNQDYRDR